MPSLVTYLTLTGGPIQVLSPDPTVDAALAVNDNWKALADSIANISGGGVVTAVTNGNGLTLTSGTLAFSGSSYSPLAGSTSITTVGTVTAGTWSATTISPTHGGTGVNNGSSTLTLAGNLSTTGAHTLSLATTANTSLTLPTSGTLATTSNLSSYLPLTGGTLTGTLTVPQINVGESGLAVIGGSWLDNGAFTTDGNGNITLQSLILKTSGGSTYATFSYDDDLGINIVDGLGNSVQIDSDNYGMLLGNMNLSLNGGGIYDQSNGWVYIDGQLQAWNGLTVNGGTTSLDNGNIGTSGYGDLSVYGSITASGLTDTPSSFQGGLDVSGGYPYSLGVTGSTSLDNGEIITDGYGNLTVQGLVISNAEVAQISFNGNASFVNQNVQFNEFGTSLDNGQITTDGSGTLTAYAFAITGQGDLLDYIGNASVYYASNSGSADSAGSAYNSNYAVDLSGGDVYTTEGNSGLGNPQIEGEYWQINGDGSFQFSGGGVTVDGSGNLTATSISIPNGNGANFGLFAQFAPPSGDYGFGGYYNGIALCSNNNDGDTNEPVFYVFVNGSDGDGGPRGAGVGAFGIESTNEVWTKHNILDDGSGNMTVISTILNPQSSAPSSPVKGQIYCDNSGNFHGYNGSAWKQFTVS